MIARLRRRLRETELQEDIDWIEGELDGLTYALVSSWRREAYLRARLQIDRYVTAPSSPTESAVPAELHVQQEEQVPLATLERNSEGTPESDREAVLAEIEQEQGRQVEVESLQEEVPPYRPAYTPDIVIPPPTPLRDNQSSTGADVTELSDHPNVQNIELEIELLIPHCHCSIRDGCHRLYLTKLYGPGTIFRAVNPRPGRENLDRVSLHPIRAEFREEQR